MRIGIDCRTLGDGEELAGVGEYTLFLIRELLRQDSRNEYVLFFSEQLPDQKIRALVGDRPQVRIVKLPKPTLPFISAHIGVARIIVKAGLDVFHAPGGHLPYFYSGRAVITIHDLAILYHPEWFPESMIERFVSTRILLHRAVRRAQRIIVPSDSTAKDLKRFYGVGSERLRVIPLASALPGESREPLNFPSGRYLLFVGTIEPRKNLLRLLQAFQKIDDRDVRLILVGKRGWKDREIMEAIVKTERVEYLGYSSPEEKRWLMERALAFVFPSQYEGFGLPVLEAMSVGTPVITSKVSSLPEVIGNSALLVDPENEDGLRDALNHIIADNMLRAEFTARGRVLAATFSWSKNAAQTIEIYQAVAGR